jgi:hypothetical protein
MSSVAGGDWEKYMMLTDKKLVRQRIIIITLSVLCVILSALAVWNYFESYL